MSDWISYQGKPLGKITLNDNATTKLVYIAEGIDSLITLFQLNPNDEVETEGQGKMTFEKFKQDYLGDISAFYPTRDAWLLKNYNAKTIDEFQEQEGRKPE